MKYEIINSPKEKKSDHAMAWKALVVIIVYIYTRLILGIKSFQRLSPHLILLAAAFVVSAALWNATTAEQEKKRAEEMEEAILLGKLSEMFDSLANLKTKRDTLVIQMQSEVVRKTLPKNMEKPKPKISHSLPASPQEYIKRYAPVAIAEMQKFGIPASIKLGQGILESNAGKSKLARTTNNHFGIKCFSKNCQKGHCHRYHDDSPKDRFKCYDSVWYSYRDHSVKLSGSRYVHLKKYGRDYKKWAYGLKKAGYATSKTYARDLIAVIERYKLHQYDQ